MVPKSPIRFEIGAPGWEREVRRQCAEMSPAYWDSFTPISRDELRRIEHELNRKLPQDFWNFMQTFGYGQFAHGGHIADPEELITYSPAATIYFPLGSYDWASDGEHVGLYVSRGEQNPDPSRFTRDTLTAHGFYLLDWLQVGSDGCAAYHNIYVGKAQRSCGYFLMCPGEVVERLPSFSAGLQKFLNYQWDTHFDLLD